MKVLNNEQDIIGPTEIRIIGKCELTTDDGKNCIIVIKTTTTKVWGSG